MRVAHLNAGNLYGGIESFLVALASIAGTTGGMEQTFVLTHEGRFATSLRRIGAILNVIGPARMSRPWSVLAARRGVADALRTCSPDVVIAHDTWPLAILGPGAKGYPLVYWQHMPAGRTFLERIASRLPVRAIISNSEFTAASAPSLFPGVPVSVIRYPVPPVPRSDRTVLRSSFGVGPDELIILQVSRMERWKGQLLHLDALKRLRSRRRWRAWFVGGASRPGEMRLRGEMLAAAAELPPNRVEFLGERQDVPLLMQAADVFCQPNIEPEPFGLVFVEALAAGLPVVATRMGGALEIIDASVGLLAEPTADAVAAALELLLEDDRLRSDLGRRGPARSLELCNPDLVVPALATVLGSVQESARAIR